MSLVLRSDATALGINCSAYLAAQGGPAPYTYTIEPGGPGGSLTTSGDEVIYKAPAVYPSARTQIETIKAVDAYGDEATHQILVAHPIGLMCEIIQKFMGLSNGRIYLWNQKIMEPTDEGIYIAVGVVNSKILANTKAYDPSANLMALQSVNVVMLCSIDIISRGLSAMIRKEEVLMALNSDYSQRQQERMGFKIGIVPVGGQFTNLSNIDGAAIPYRFNIAVNVHYSSKKTSETWYFDTFDSNITTEP